MSNERWAGFPRAETVIECSGGHHRVRWDRGELSALDHIDPDAERALAALGGDPCACIEILDDWERHRGDARMLVLGSRGAGDLIPAPEPDDSSPRRVPGRWVAAGGGRRRAIGNQAVSLIGRSGAAPGSDEDAELSAARRLLTLLSLGGGLQRRLIATVAAHHRAGAPSPVLEAALYGRVLSSLSAWQGRAEPGLELELIADGVRPSLSTSDEDATLVARLPFSWLVDVWGRELEVIWGRFCLAAHSENGTDWELLSVGPDLAGPDVIRVALPR